FEELFEGVRALPWEDFIGERTRFPVNGKCARSQLMSVRDCQSITKKAIVERLRGRYRTDWFVEDAETVSIDVALHGDIAQLTLDASGTALNRRGYRTWNGEAPLRETLAAALVTLSPWRPGIPLRFMCGTGTLMIEAAMRMAHRARSDPRVCHRVLAQYADGSVRRHPRAGARRADPSRIEGISGSISTRRRAGEPPSQAGRAGRTRPFQTADMRDCRRAQPQGVFLCNPPLANA
ncbi:MAG: THUMP domain-containing protein, partial [Christensenellales bacterium]